MIAGSELCSILFVWDGSWECETSNHWKFSGKQSKIVRVLRDVGFSQLLEKAYSVTKVSREEYEIQMCGWFTYKDYLPPCPLGDDDEVQGLIDVNREKTLSVPVCLTITRREEDTETQSKREAFESESSNPVVAPTGEMLGTVSPETQPPAMTPSVPLDNEQSTDIGGNDPQEFGCDDYMQSVDDEEDNFFFDDMEGIAFGSPIGQQGGDETYNDENGHQGDDETNDAENIIPLYNNSLVSGQQPPPTIEEHYDPNPIERPLPVVSPNFVPHNDGCTEGVHSGPSRPRQRKRKRVSVITGQSMVGDRSTNPEVTCNAVQVENDFEENEVLLSKAELKYRLALISLLKNRELVVKKSDKSRLIAICIDKSNCQWRLRASKINDGDLWIIRKYLNIHTCSLELMHHDHRQAYSKVLAQLIKYRYAASPYCYPPRGLSWLTFH